MVQGCLKRGQVEMAFRAHGGERPGAGRKPKGTRAGARHVARPRARPASPVHVTTRIVGSTVGLRRKDTYLAIREATLVTTRRENFLIVHMSIQRDHLHMIVEAESKAAPSRGMRGFSISAARQINRALTARGGDLVQCRLDPSVERSVSKRRQRDWITVTVHRVGRRSDGADWRCSAA